MSATSVGINVSCQLSNAKSQQMVESRIALLKIFSSLQYLAVQGLAVRGHTDEASNLLNLLQLRSEDYPQFKNLMSHSVLKQLITCIKYAVCYTIIVAETSDIAIQELVSICFGIRILIDVLQRFRLNLSNCKGQCFDGASNMAGIYTGNITNLVLSTICALFGSLTEPQCARESETHHKKEILCQAILGLPKPQLPRKRYISKCIDEGSSDYNVHPFGTPENIYQCVYFEVIDMSVQLKFLISATNDYDEITAIYKDDIDPGRLLLHMNMFLDTMNAHKISKKDDSLASIVKIFKKDIYIMDMLSEFVNLVRLHIAERSFLSLRRPKTYLRSTMSKHRLNSVAILNCHRDLTHSLNLNEIANYHISE
ncbi:hypothetical protein PR048_008652, partial [Dryococelus australis]